MDTVNIKKYTQDQSMEDARGILTAFDKDSKAQECLRLYKLLPDSEKDTMIHSMDAFLRGFNEGKSSASL